MSAERRFRQRNAPITEILKKNMFDDQMPKPQEPTAQAPAVQDMFDDAPSVPANLPISSAGISPSPVRQASATPNTAPTPQATPQPTVQPAPVAPTQVQTQKTQTFAPMPPKSSFSKILTIIIIVFVALGIVALAGYLAFRMMTQPAPVIDSNEQEDVATDEIPLVEEEEPVVLEEQDTDGDGLTDAQEIEVGTDIESIDTDKDSLGDKEEVQVYGTDPLKADTDEDSYLDGQEVSAGYNPNGPGKLFELPK